MLVNVSHNDKQVKRKIAESVGRPFSFRERVKLRGIGSPRMVVDRASEPIKTLLEKDNRRDYCNIELRPNGIIIGFRVLLESYALVIPFHKLVLFKTDPETYSIHIDHITVRLVPSQNSASFHAFMAKLLQTKNANTTTRIEDV